jgi:muramoyltetrapeptide carboxypeptidase
MKLENRMNRATHTFAHGVKILEAVCGNSIRINTGTMTVMPQLLKDRLFRKRALFPLALVLIATSLPAMEPVFPPALRPGDTIQFVAPASSLNKERMERCQKRLEALGFQVKVPADLYRKLDYLAGTDQQRADELNEAFRNPDVDAVFPGSGGYGTMRILELLDYDAIRQNPKVIVGFSDITALHAAIQQRTGLITFHTPSPMYGLGSEDDLSPLSAHWFWRAILADRNSEEKGYLISPLGWQADATAADLKSVCELDPPITVTGGKARGRLAGGNLSLVAALMGTPYQIETADKILFLEDVGEAPYRIDRMLCTMRLGGLFEEVKGVVLGQFTRRDSEDTSDESRSIDDVLDEYFSELGVPVVKNFPLGHHKCNTSLPIGAMCELDADQLSIQILENPVQ